MVVGIYCNQIIATLLNGGSAPAIPDYVANKSRWIVKLDEHEISWRLIDDLHGRQDLLGACSGSPQLYSIDYVACAWGLV